MEESAFEFDSAHVAETSRRFPAQRLTHAAPHPVSDVNYIATAAEYGRHAWDEGGHI